MLAETDTCIKISKINTRKHVHINTKPIYNIPDSKLKLPDFFFLHLILKNYPIFRVKGKPISLYFEIQDGKLLLENPINSNTRMKTKQQIIGKPSQETTSKSKWNCKSKKTLEMNKTTSPQTHTAKAYNQRQKIRVFQHFKSR